MPEHPPSRPPLPVRWVIAFAVALMQNGVAVFALHSSARDILSDGACLGGIFGTLANLAIIGVVLVWSIILGVRSCWVRRWHPDLSALLFVGLSSATAILVGMAAGLRCTV